MIKKVFVLLACLFVLSNSIAFAENVAKYTDDYRIKEALTMLDDAGASEVFSNLRENSVKIMFYDLTQISYKYGKHFAMNTVDNWGNRYILINSQYRNAPTEQIACLIAHESCHKAKVATLAEETLATRTEARYWAILKKHSAKYSDNALTNRLNNLAHLETISTPDNDMIQNKISNSKFYREQLSF